MSEEHYDLPDGWQWVALEQVCEPVEQVNPGRFPGRTFRYVDISSINNTRNDIEAIKEYAGSNAPSRARKPIKTDDVLFSTVRPYLRNIASVPKALDGQIASTGFCVLRARSAVDPRYLFRYLLTDFFVRQVTELQRGISYPAVTDKDVYAQSIPLPPLEEQHRIVARIEALFAQSRGAREALARIPPLLKQFRLAVLSKAFRGELSERDPNDEPAAVMLERIRAERNARSGGDKHHEPELPETRNLPTLPDAWVWTKLGHLINLLQYGTSVKAAADSTAGVPILRMGNIQSGQIDFRDLKYIDPQQEDVEKYRILKDDILINRTNSPELVGKAARFNVEGHYVFASYLIRLRANPNIMSAPYLDLVINSEIGRQHIGKVKHQVAGQANINSQNIRELPVPLAPLHEQRRIVTKIQALFAQADAIQRTVAAAQRRAERVDQAILARAFRGGL